MWSGASSGTSNSGLRSRIASKPSCSSAMAPASATLCTPTSCGSDGMLSAWMPAATSTLVMTAPVFAIATPACVCSQTVSERNFVAKPQRPLGSCCRTSKAVPPKSWTASSSELQPSSSLVCWCVSSSSTSRSRSASDCSSCS